MISELVQLRDFAGRYTAAWCSQDAASVAAFYAADGELRVNAGSAAQGRSAITEVVRGYMTAFPDLEVILDDALFQGDRAEYHWKLTGTNTGPGGTGHRVRISGYEVWSIGEDGLIARSQGHFDSAEYQRQLAHGAGARKTQP
jgi:nuclear transport factor 2 (NTF2) superfamily protein